ncbi:hypothetical protein [Dysgonomonas termitidis]|uniref:Uncharacterized protein n=1 Tax=Dysgonomonas termitidis TaxID=1516126 RepID=A0ABV9KRL6_9BACT
MSNKKEIHQIAGDLANAGFNTSREKFLEQMRNLHPTSQQLFAGLVLAWIKDYAENYRIDDRNRRSIEECRKVINSFNALNGNEELKTKFPCI